MALYTRLASAAAAALGRSSSTPSAAARGFSSSAVRLSTPLRQFLAPASRAPHPAPLSAVRWQRRVALPSGVGGGVPARGFHEDALPPKTVKIWKNKFANVPEIDQRAIIAAFDLIDLDENGVIDKGEQAALELILADAGFERKDIIRAIKEMDADGNGEIDRDEFVTWWLSASIHPRSKKIRDATRSFHRDDNRGDDKLD
mmetsp:Transcript_43101/g.84283  ORF Transcript_43101/g.84283 Transcript_43101/m.84283 type:complete len:201 (-) Transcript_43101:127-729(-)